MICASGFHLFNFVGEGTVMVELEIFLFIEFYARVFDNYLVFIINFPLYSFHCLLSVA